MRICCFSEASHPWRGLASYSVPSPPSSRSPSPSSPWPTCRAGCARVAMPRRAVRARHFVRMQSRCTRARRRSRACHVSSKLTRARSWRWKRQRPSRAMPMARPLAKATLCDDENRTESPWSFFERRPLMCWDLAVAVTCSEVPRCAQLIVRPATNHIPRRTESLVTAQPRCARCPRTRACGEVVRSAAVGVRGRPRGCPAPFVAMAMGATQMRATKMRATLKGLASERAQIGQARACPYDAAFVCCALFWQDKSPFWRSNVARRLFPT